MDFDSAVEHVVGQAKAEAELSLADTMYTAATEGRDTKAALELLKHRHGWRERTDINHTSEDGSMTPKAGITAVDAIEAAKQYQKIMGKDE
jgi:hypothetical protein